MSQVLRLTNRNFKQEVFQSEVPVLVKFSGSWCIPSHIFFNLGKPMARRVGAQSKKQLQQMIQSAVRGFTFMERNGSSW